MFSTKTLCSITFLIAMLFATSYAQLTFHLTPLTPTSEYVELIIDKFPMADDEDQKWSISVMISGLVPVSAFEFEQASVGGSSRVVKEFSVDKTNKVVSVKDISVTWGGKASDEGRSIGFYMDMNKKTTNDDIIFITVTATSKKTKQTIRQHSELLSTHKTLSEHYNLKLDKTDDKNMKDFTIELKNIKIDLFQEPLSFHTYRTPTSMLEYIFIDKKAPPQKLQLQQDPPVPTIYTCKFNTVDVPVTLNESYELVAQLPKNDAVILAGSTVNIKCPELAFWTYNGDFDDKYYFNHVSITNPTPTPTTFTSSFIHKDKHRLLNLMAIIRWAVLVGVVVAIIGTIIGLLICKKRKKACFKEKKPTNVTDAYGNEQYYSI